MSIPETKPSPQIVDELNTIEQWRQKTNFAIDRLNSLYTTITDQSNEFNHLKVGNSIYAGNLVVNNSQILSCQTDGKIIPSGIDFSTLNDIVNGGAASLWEQHQNGVDIFYNSGNVGIGSVSPTEKLEVVGNITASGDITSTSDISLKENLETISNPIDKIKNLNGYTFNRIGHQKRSVGLVAQEVEKVLPEAVLGEDGSKSLAYGNVVALLVETVKEQQNQIDELKTLLKNERDED